LVSALTALVGFFTGAVGFFPTEVGKLGGRFFGLAVGLLTWSAYYGRLFQVGFLPVGF
jgi:hypothetical protein